MLSVIFREAVHLKDLEKAEVKGANVLFCYRELKRRATRYLPHPAYI
jgi:hypothetical protein